MSIAALAELLVVLPRPTSAIIGCFKNHTDQVPDITFSGLRTEIQRALANRSTDFVAIFLQVLELPHTTVARAGKLGPHDHDFRKRPLSRNKQTPPR